MNKVIKVAFVGSHGVGKTTLIKGLKEALDLNSVNIIRESATRVHELAKTDPALRINQDATLEAQMYILGLQLEEENAKMLALNSGACDGNKYANVLLCDRSVFDALAYTHYRITRGDKYQWASKLPKCLAQWVCSSINNSYDLIFYIPISFPLVADDVRPADNKFQEDIDALMQELFLQNSLNFVHMGEMARHIDRTVILSGTVDRRVAIAKKYIDETLEKKITQIDWTKYQSTALRAFMGDPKELAVGTRPLVGLGVGNPGKALAGEVVDLWKELKSTGKDPTILSAIFGDKLPDGCV
jgi:hypothetical protein